MQICRRSRAGEVDNIEEWSRANNLALSRSKSVEIVFTDSKWRHHVQLVQ